jgi:glycolate oxidase
MIPEGFAESVAQIVGASFVRQDDSSLEAYGADALKQTHRADLVALPGSVSEVAAVAELCSERLVPLVARGAGTGQTGGSVPLRGGVVLSLERLNRILEIDQDNLLAVVEPHVRTGDLQEAVERVGLFYPPDPASLKDSGRAPSSTARQGSTCSAWRRCCRAARSSGPARRPSRTSSATT